MMPHLKFITRAYQTTDSTALADIYYHTIHKINSRDYSPEQIQAWAPSLQLEKWQKKWIMLCPIVVLYEDKIVGFAELEANGHIDCFYVHHEFQRQGAGSALMNALESQAFKTNLNPLYAEVSITAKPFFQHKGFTVIDEESVEIRGCWLRNFKMEKSYA